MYKYLNGYAASLMAACFSLVSCAGGDRGAEQSYAPTFACDSAVVNVTVAEYDSLNNGYIEAFTYTYDDLGEVAPTKLDKDGKITLRFALQGDMSLFFNNAMEEERYGVVRVAPGEVTDVTIYPDSIVTNGRFADFNRVLSKYKGKYGMDIMTADYFRYDMSGDEYTDAILARYAERKAAIDADKELSEAQRIIEKAELVNGLLSLASDRKFAGRCNYLNLHGYEGGICEDSISTDMSEANYASVIAAIDPDDCTMLMSANPGVSTSLGSVDWSAAGAGGTLLGALSDYRKAVRLVNEGKADTTLKESLRAYPDRFFADALESISGQAKKRFDDAAKIVSATPDVPAEGIIDAIAAKYPGKVVLIDCWATWCGPCKAGIAVNEPLKADVLSDPDIVWVYVTDESSPVSAYYKMIPEIKGEHYRLTGEQSKVMYEKYGIDGIPFYFLVDRKGTVSSRPDFRDHELLVSTILEELKK